MGSSRVLSELAALQDERRKLQRLIYALAERVAAQSEIPNNAAGGENKRRMTERVWANYPLPSK